MPRKRARSVVHAIHRRRVVRAGAATGVSALAVGGLALGAINLRPSGELSPGAVPMPTGGAYAWCDLAAYPAVNSAALGAYPYAGRIYVNEADNEYVYVAPDGTNTVLTPDADGNYFATSPTGEQLRAPTGMAGHGGWSHMAWDLSTDGSGAGRAYFVTPDEPPPFETVGPGLLYEWTTSTPGDAPTGVNAAGILQLQLASIGFSVSNTETSFVPDGAAVERVLRWSDGRERVTPVELPVAQAVPVVEGDDLAGLESVSLRVVGLPDGATYEVTSTYDASKTWAAACGTALDLRAPSATPLTTPNPSISWADSSPTPSDEPPLPGSSPSPAP